MERGDFYPKPKQPEYNETTVSSHEFEEEDRELEEALANIWDIAHEHHLDPYPTHFEVVPAKVINRLGSYGIPGRYSHWTHGRDYRQMKTTYDYGLSKIYELVINSNPSQAFLLENNPPIENKFVMAHVLGHTDFFKNNLLFQGTRRDMPEAAARNAARIREYEETYGRYVVEQFLDAALAIEDQIDPYLIRRPSREEELNLWHEQARHDKKAPQDVSHEFDDLFGPPPLKIPHGPELAPDVLHIPPSPDSDVLGFIRNHAPYLQDWQRDIVDIVRNEALYFYPQRRTKIMNEGWAAYWHKRIMREMADRNLISDSENEAWWKVHSGVVSESQRSLNPYHLGMKVFEYLEDYYNGHLTDEETAWLQSEGVPTYPAYDGPLKDSPATPMLRDAMIHNDDQSFIRNHFNKIVADRMNLFVYEKRQLYHGAEQTVVKSTGWIDIRDQLVNSFNHNGTPSIVVADGDFRYANELFLRHEFDGHTLDPDYINKTLPQIFKLWKRSVHLETTSSTNQRVIYSYDGRRVTRT